MSKDYVLGTDDVELARLKRQHELWASFSRDLWSRAEFKKRKKILDLGCGPGFTSLEMAQFLGQGHEILSVDLSEKFLKHLEKEAAALGPAAAKIGTFLGSLDRMSLPENDFEAAYCRWLMIFVPDVGTALKKIWKHLKPGALFCLQEYVAYENLMLCPEVPEMKEISAAVFKSWKDQGGDPNRGRDLPRLLEENGFKVKELKTISRVARPGEDLWEWPSQFFTGHLPKLIAAGYLQETTANSFLKKWQSASKEKGSFFLAPGMMDIIAEKV